MLPFSIMLTLVDKFLSALGRKMLYKNVYCAYRKQGGIVYEKYYEKIKPINKR